MVFLLLSITLFLAGGMAALASGRGRTASRVGAFSAIAASVAGLLPVAAFFLHGSAPLAATIAKLPMGSLALRLDLLGAVFLAPVLLLVAVAALYGMGNGDGCDEPDGAHTGAHWLFYNLLAAGMVLTVTADDAFMFLLAWETMSLAPFFLITMHDTSSATRSAAWIYLVAAHLGALFLLAFFALLAARNGGELSFAVFATQASSISPEFYGGAGLLFLLALVGFGAKIGIMPLHVWMPEAYPAASSHVAAVMSGAMVNMGVYGIVRSLSFLGTGEAWWAYTLMGFGAFSGFTGIIMALAQPAIKRALAFSSVENMGIICMGLGVALLCMQNGHTGAAALAATGTLVHMVNHALSKGLLFLCAGCVRHGAGHATLRFLGGLQKRMPVVGWCFVIGSAAIAALPPLNGFAGEFFIYLGMVFGGTAFAHGLAPEYSLVFWACLFILAAIGGFTLFCFARLYGIAFLGQPRTNSAVNAVGPTRNETAAIVLLSLFCLLSAFAAPRVATICHASITSLLYRTDYTPALAAAPDASQSVPVPYVPNGFTPPRVTDSPYDHNSAISLLRQVNNAFLLFIIAALAIFLLRRRILRDRHIAESQTWGCAYIAPSSRMQYSAGSFSRPAGYLMRTLLRQKVEMPAFTEYFPLQAQASLSTPDWMETKGFVPLFSLVERVADICKRLQHGRVNGYILYILITLVALLAWKLG